MRCFFERKYLWPFLFLLFLVVGGISVFARNSLTASRCTGESSVTLASQKFSVIVADTPELRTQGLSGTPRLPSGTGMLFLFESSSAHSFWMKDMNYPIDIIWIDENWRVVGIVPSALPSSYPDMFTSPPTTRYVLEVNAGVTSEIGLAIDSVVRQKVQCKSIE